MSFVTNAPDGYYGALEVANRLNESLLQELVRSFSFSLVADL